MSRKPTGRTTKLVRVPIRFEAEVKAFIQQLKQQEAQQLASQKGQMDASR